MIVMRLQAGFANQLFQYAVARNLALKRGTTLFLDTSWYDQADQSDGVGRRVYELGSLTIQEEPYRPTLIHRAQLKLTPNNRFIDETQPYVFHPEVLELPNNSQLFGFFQNQRYFTEIRDLLLKEFTLKTPAEGDNAVLLAEISADSQAVSIHVRRGDYATSSTHNAFHGLTGLAYYRAAVEKLIESVPKPSLYIFSDDPAWCKENLNLDYPTTYVDNGNTGAEDMRLMRACHHNIIANSSFSWWGAWLNEHDDKIVIAPKQWLAGGTMDTSDLLPSSWIAL